MGFLSYCTLCVFLVHTHMCTSSRAPNASRPILSTGVLTITKKHQNLSRGTKNGARPTGSPTTVIEPNNPSHVAYFPKNVYQTFPKPLGMTRPTSETKHLLFLVGYRISQLATQDRVTVVKLLKGE